MTDANKLLCLMVATALGLSAVEDGRAATPRSTPLAPLPSEIIPDPMYGAGRRALSLLVASPQVLTQADGRQREADRLFQQGIQQVSGSQFREAIQSWEQALEIYREIQDRRREGQTLGNLGGAYYSLGEYRRALEFMEQGLATFRRLGDRVNEVNALDNIGLIYRDLEDYRRAIEFYEQSLPIFRELGDQGGEGVALGNLGNIYQSLGDYRRALEYHEQALATFRALDDRRNEGSALGNLGNTYQSLGDYRRAIEYHEQHLAIARDLDYRAGEGRALSSLGNAYLSLDDYPRAIEYHEQHLAIARDIDNRRGEGVALGNLGNVYWSLGDYRRAIGYYEQDLAIARDIGDRNGERRALGNLGNAYWKLGDYHRAIDYYEQDLAIARDIGKRDGEGTTLRNLGIAYLSLGDYRQAITFQQQSLVIARDIGDRRGEGGVLNNLGLTYRNLGQGDRALEFYSQALPIFNVLDSRAESGRTLGNIGRLYNAQAQPELAITFLKASVDIHESIRGEIRQLDRDLQQSFTDTVADDYRLLADLLLQQDRVLEAQEVLDLLKLQELDDYQIRNVRGTEETRQGISFWQFEREILALFYEQLDSEDDINRFFSRADVADRVAQLQRNARSQNLNPEQLARLQGNLQQAGNAALLYPLVLDDRLELILVTTRGITRHTVPVSRVDLNRAIVAFRSDIEDPFSNPLPNAQQLYQWLIAPLADEIDAAGAETILYAADGQLRYIPLAALHDGEQWLTQRYTLNHITAASLMDFSQTEAAPLSILAGAFPEHDLAVQVGEEQVRFRGLPYAQIEVQQLAENWPSTQAFFSEAFSRAAIEPRLGNHTVLHLATHGQFRSGHPNDSFILLGNGDRITLFDLDQWDLPNVDLVVLSACETAVSGPGLGTGEEILGFGYQIQRTGARAAIASLWQVSDPGTESFMTGFYRSLQAGQSKAGALRQAQIALIASEEGDSSTDSRSIGVIGVPTEESASEATRVGSYSHPYYWAPFILIGNGL